jgi:hypothetical protein
MKKLFLITLISLLAACSPKTDISGTYVSETANRTFTFQPNGKAFESSETTKFPEFPYSVDGKAIKTNGLAYNFSVMDDGSINGGAAYGVLKKQ